MGKEEPYKIPAPEFIKLKDLGADEDVLSRINSTQDAKGVISYLEKKNEKKKKEDKDEKKEDKDEKKEKKEKKKNLKPKKNYGKKPDKNNKKDDLYAFTDRMNALSPQKVDPEQILKRKNSSTRLCIIIDEENPTGRVF